MGEGFASTRAELEKVSIKVSELELALRKQAAASHQALDAPDARADAASHFTHAHPAAGSRIAPASPSAPHAPSPAAAPAEAVLELGAQIEAARTSLAALHTLVTEVETRSAGTARSHFTYYLGELYL